MSADMAISTLASPTTDINADDVNIVDQELLTHLNNLKNGGQGFDVLKFMKSTATLASDTLALAVTNMTRYVVVDTEGGAATDNLSSITGGTDGQMLFLYSANAARVITVKQGTSNVKLTGGVDTILRTDVPLQLFYNATAGVWSSVGDLPAIAINTSRTSLAAPVGFVDISSIPATFKHLLLILEMRTDAGGTLDNILLRFNGDSAVGNYFQQYGFHSNTTYTSAESLGATYGACFLGSTAAGSTAPANTNGSAIVYIPNYASIGLQRMVLFQGGARGANTTGTLRAAYGVSWWTNIVNAINTIRILPVSGSNLAANSAYTLYGLN